MKLIALIVILFPALALAEDMIVPVPRSNMELEKWELPAKPATTAWQIGVGSVSTPTGLNADSNLMNTTEFAKTSNPSLSLNYLSEMDTYGSGLTLSSKFGGSLMSVERSGTQNLGDHSSTVSQSANIFTARAGVELAAKTPVYGLQPYLGLAYAPRYMNATSSEFDDGISTLMSVGEGSAGLTYEIPSVARFIGLSRFGAEVGFIAARGLGSSFADNETFFAIRIQ